MKTKFIFVLLFGMIFIPNIRAEDFPKLTHDSLVVITPQQLKQTNLIFVEHNKLLLENEQLEMEVLDYEELLDYASRQDSLRQIRFSEFQDQLEMNNRMIQEQQELLQKQRNKNKILGYTLGGVAVVAITSVLVAILK